MREHEVPQTAVKHLRDELRSLRVGQMAEVRAHAPLQGRRVGSFEEKSRVVVRLQDESVEIAQCESKRPRRRTEIGDDGGADATPSLDALFERVRDRLDGVVGNGNGAYPKSPPEEQRSILWQREAELARWRIAQSEEGALCRMDARADLARNGGRAEAMVRVLVREQHVGDVAQVQAGLGAPPPRLLEAQPRVDQYARASCLDPGRVAAAPAGEDAQAH